MLNIAGMFQFCCTIFWGSKSVQALGVLQPMEIAQDTKPVAQADEIWGTKEVRGNVETWETTKGTSRA